MTTKLLSRTTLGSRIKTARHLSEMSQDDLAKLLKLTNQQISSYETDKSIPPSDKLLRIAQLCKVDPGWLLSGEGNPF